MKKILLLSFVFLTALARLHSSERCLDLNIKLPKNIRIERAIFDSHSSNNLFLVGEGGNGVFLYDILQKRIKQIYYARLITDSIVQSSIKNLRFKLFYKGGTSAEIDLYAPEQMAVLKESDDPCYVKSGNIYLRMEGGDVRIAPFLGNPSTCLFSNDLNLLLFANQIAGGYVFGMKTGEIAKLGFGSDFKFVNSFDIIFVKNSKVGDRCTDSYIYYWLNSAVESFIIYRDKDGCIRYPDANKDSLIFVKDFRLYVCPLDLTGGVLDHVQNR